MRIKATRLKNISQAELELPFGCVGRAFACHFSKRAAGWVHVGVIPVGVISEVEGLCSEDQFVVLMARDEVEALLERGIEALEARAVDNVASAARGKSADCGGLEDTRIEPRCGAGRAKLVRQQR